MAQLTKKQKADVAEWNSIKEQIDGLKGQELVLRKKLFATVFKDPVEGSGNKADIENGYILQGKHTINRSVDQAAAHALMEGSDNVKAVAEKIFVRKYSLDLKAYRTLSDEDQNLVADAVVAKPGTPALEVKLPKR